MTVDNHVGSPFQDRVYVTWTDVRRRRHAPTSTRRTRPTTARPSARRSLVSADSAAVREHLRARPTPQGTCNENQFSQPFTGPGRRALRRLGQLQQRDHGRPTTATRCCWRSRPTAAAPSARRSRSRDYYDLPDCATYQARQRPGPRLRAGEGRHDQLDLPGHQLPVGRGQPDEPEQVVVTFGSYINQHSNEANGCVPAGFSPATGTNLYTGVKTAGACNNDILVSVSDRRRRHLHRDGTTDPRTQPTRQPGRRGRRRPTSSGSGRRSPRHGKLAVSYYDRQYGNDETTGSRTSASPARSDLDGVRRQTRVTSSSMPPPTQFGGSSSATTPGSRRREGPPDLDGHARPGPVPLPRHRRAGVPPAVCTGTGPAPTPRRPTTRTSSPPRWRFPTGDRPRTTSAGPVPSRGGTCTFAQTGLGSGTRRAWPIGH